MGIKKMFLILNLLLILGLFSCGKEKKKIEPNYKPASESNKYSETDFYNFKHYLDNDYAFDIKITNIRVIEQKDVFEVQKDKFSIPEKVNGNSIIIDFDITNPYSRDMQIPFPDYYQIGAKEFSFPEYVVNRGIEICVDNNTIIKDNKGVLLDKLGEYGSSNRVNVDFKSNETKSMQVEFPNPFPLTIEKIIFIAFDKHVTKQVTNSSNLEGEELERYLADKCTTYGLIIDLKSKKIVDLISVNK
ncbi:uncharacterized protein YkvS [Flavobacterium sp. 7E]|uniref:hypothetical protein n=1 Tax=Flavobacterium sp. 7E TaxID=2735898 RepID=UPI00156D7C49|nr:hypothetical protein [Flavobacterium sp. 7E]NRS88947.1 uncharacterized protein YkvS [Flavobacterium sp. 7E]